VVVAARLSARCWLIAALAGCAALLVGAWTTAVSWSVRSPVWWQEYPPRAAGAVVVVAGVVVWARLPSPRIGQLVVLGGAVYYLQYLRATDGVWFAVGFCLAYAWMGIAAHVLLAWPTGTLPSLVDRVYVLVAYVYATGTEVVRFLVDHPRPPWALHLPQPATFWGGAGSAGAVLLGAFALVLVARRWLAAPPARRRPYGPIWLGIAAAALVKVAEAVASVLPTPFWVKPTLAALFTVAVIVLVPALYLIRWVLLRFGHRRVVALLVEIERNLASIADPGELQQALARSLGDPTLTIAYPLDDGGHVDVRGRPVPFTPGAPGRALTRVLRQGRLVAVIEHDAALRDHRQVTDAAVAAVGLALDNARLHATLQAQLDQIRASRLALAQTAFDERQRIQRDLHDGVQHRFFGTLLRLDAARGELPPDGPAARAVAAAHTELTDAIRAWRELTQGIYPTVLLRHGLAAAVENLADRAVLPVEFTVTGQRWAKHVEITAYFVVSEGLANVYKHSGASHARVAVRAADGELVVEVVDDGRGGAVPGDGLAGLRHRVEAVGGRLAVSGEPGAGTTVLARIPAEPRPDGDEDEDGAGG
jgi:signal transduction histidine kinase